LSPRELKATLTSILAYHFVAGPLSSKEIAAVIHVVDTVLSHNQIPRLGERYVSSSFAAPATFQN